MTQQEDPRLQPRADWQTKSRGSNEQEYEIYKAAAEALAEALAEDGLQAEDTPETPEEEVEALRIEVAEPNMPSAMPSTPKACRRSRSTSPRWR